MTPNVNKDHCVCLTSTPLEHTIDIIIKKIYEKHEITTVFTKNEIKKLLTICTKSVNFSFNNDIYIEIDSVAMGSTLGPIIANIFLRSNLKVS